MVGGGVGEIYGDEGRIWVWWVGCVGVGVEFMWIVMGV